MEKQIMWAVYNPEGICLTSTLSYSMGDAKDSILSGHATKEAWDVLERNGWQVSEVEVTITKRQ